MRGRTLVFVGVALSGAACRPAPDRSAAQGASAQLRAEDTARRDSVQRVIEATRYATRPVELRGPTVVAFYPNLADTTRLAADTLALPAVAPFRRRLEQYRAACAKAGYRFEVRDSRGVHVVDPRRPVYTVFRVEADSVGLVIAIPGQALHVWYGLQLEATLPARLRAVLQGPRMAPQAGT